MRKSIIDQFVSEFGQTGFMLINSASHCEGQVMKDGTVQEHLFNDAAVASLSSSWYTSAATPLIVAAYEEERLSGNSISYPLHMA